MPAYFRDVKKFLDFAKFVNQAQAVGKVVGKDVSQRAKVAVQLNRLNPYLNIYFPESYNLYVSDIEDKAIVGDIVFIKKLDEPRRTVETHEIKDIIYKVGHVVDPLTGLRCNKDGYIGEPLEDSVLDEMRAKMRSREISHEYSFEYNPKRALLNPRRFKDGR